MVASGFLWYSRWLPGCSVWLLGCSEWLLRCSECFLWCSMWLLGCSVWLLEYSGWLPGCSRWFIWCSRWLLGWFWVVARVFWVVSMVIARVVWVVSMVFYVGCYSVLGGCLGCSVRLLWCIGWLLGCILGGVLWCSRWLLGCSWFESIMIDVIGLNSTFSVIV